MAASLLFIDFVEDGYERLSPRQSGKQAAETLRPHVGPGTSVYAVEIYDQSLQTGPVRYMRWMYN